MNALPPLPRLPRALVVVLALASTATAFARSSYETRDPNNIKQILQGSMVYASDNNLHFPNAPDVWTYAELLGATGIIESSYWLSARDPANDYPHEKSIPVLLSESSNLQRRQPNPQFRQLKLSLAVPTGVTLRTSHPPSTPLIWTRGLQSDGTWSPHSPYGSEGGHIAFVSGRVAFFRNLHGEDGRGVLQRFDGTGPTANILEALPPGARISEYVPTPAEQLAWASADRSGPPEPLTWLKRFEPSAPVAILCAFWTPFIALSLRRLLKGQPNAIDPIAWAAITLLILWLLAAIISRF